MFFFVPIRYRPLVRITIGAIVLILGIVVAARIPLVVGGLVLAWGIVSALGRLRQSAQDAADDGYADR